MKRKPNSQKGENELKKRIDKVFEKPFSRETLLEIKKEGEKELKKLN